MFANSTEALDWLYNTQLFGMKLGLEGITRLLHACGLSHLFDATSRKPQLVHVAGTNGKGSTCAMMESIARCSGYRTALFTSPHLVSFHERIRVNNEMIDDASLCRLIQKLHDLTADWDPCPTFFELTTALALMFFDEQQTELIFLETGMGGRLDATNALPKDLAVIVPIGLDHTQFLGSDLSTIAGEKAGIITSALPVICAPQEPAAAGVIAQQCQATGSTLQVVTQPCTLPLGLVGSHQRMNAAVAVAAMQALPSFRGTCADIDSGLAQVRWAGRFERVEHAEKLLVLDGAHNAHAMRCLVDTWQWEFGADCKPCCIFAAAADKDVEAVLELLSPIVGRWILPKVQSPRIAAPVEMAAMIQRVSDAPIECCEGLDSTWELLDAHAPNLLCGSLFLVGEMKSVLADDGASYRKTMQ